MACKQHTIEIREHKYAYTQLPATESLKLKFRLAGIFGGALNDLMAGLGRSEKEQLSAFSGALETVFKGADSDGMVELIKYILSPAFRDGERLVFDDVYTNNFSEMYEALFWVLTVEYGDFIKDAGQLM